MDCQQNEKLIWLRVSGGLSLEVNNLQVLTLTGYRLCQSKTFAGRICSNKSHIYHKEENEVV